MTSPKQPSRTPNAYEIAVSTLLLNIYGLTWADACGDHEPLLQAESDGWTPDQFVHWWANKYDLDPITSYW